MRVVIIVFGVIVGVIVAAVATFLLGMRTKTPFVIDGVRRLNKRFMNPMQMKDAGTAGAYAGIIHHVGRKSGTEYQTPIGVESHPEGFFVVLPYGAGADWVRNVLAAGEAVIDHEGQSHKVTSPRIANRAEIEDLLSGSDRMTINLFGVDEFLVVHTETAPRNASVNSNQKVSGTT